MFLIVMTRSIIAILFSSLLLTVPSFAPAMPQSILNATIAQDEPAPSQASGEETPSEEKPAQESNPLTDEEGDQTAVVVNEDDMVSLSFKDESLEGIIPFIVEWTGKAVMLNLPYVKNKKITLITNKLITKEEALQLLFQACRLSDVAVVESEDVIMMESLQGRDKL